MSASTYVYVTEMQALASGGTMPGGGMLAQKDGDMPPIDMNAAVATAGPTATGMPAGAMYEVATDDMPAGDMRPAISSSTLRDMPGGADGDKRGRRRHAEWQHACHRRRHASLTGKFSHATVRGS